MASDRSDEGSDLPTELAQPARHALAQAGYRQLDQLTMITEADLKQLHSIGPKALDQLRRALDARGLSFASAKRRQ